MKIAYSRNRFDKVGSEKSTCVRRARGNSVNMRKYVYAVGKIDLLGKDNLRKQGLFVPNKSQNTSGSDYCIFQRPDTLKIVQRCTKHVQVSGCYGM